MIQIMTIVFNFCEWWLGKEIVSPYAFTYMFKDPNIEGSSWAPNIPQVTLNRFLIFSIEIVIFSCIALFVFISYEDGGGMIVSLFLCIDKILLIAIYESCISKSNYVFYCRSNFDCAEH